jgi:hypothetical protein
VASSSLGANSKQADDLDREGESVMQTDITSVYFTLRSWALFTDK